MRYAVLALLLLFPAALLSCSSAAPPDVPASAAPLSASPLPASAAPVPVLTAPVAAPVAALVAGPAVQADMHLDTPLQMLRRRTGLDDPALEAGLPELKKGGTTLAVMVLYPPKEGDWAASAEAALRKVEAEVERLEEVELARSPEEARRIIAAGRIAVVISLEGAHALDRSGVEGLRALHARGLSMLGLTWSFSNRFAGSSGDEVGRQGGGLTAAGRELIAEARRLGMLVDVSHASRQTVLDACALHSGPVIASHSDAAAVHAHARNLTDPEIRCIAESGGVIGLNLHAPFLGGSRDIAQAVRHVQHLREVGGAPALALGSDFDGLITAPRDLRRVGDLPALWDALAGAGMPAEEILAMRGSNFLRAWEAAAPEKTAPAPDRAGE